MEVQTIFRDHFLKNHSIIILLSSESPLLGLSNLKTFFNLILDFMDPKDDSYRMQQFEVEHPSMQGGANQTANS